MLQGTGSCRRWPHAESVANTLAQTIDNASAVIYQELGGYLVDFISYTAGNRKRGCQSHLADCKGALAQQHITLCLQKSRDEFPNLIFKVSAHDHTACGDAAHDDQVGQCLPAAEGEPRLMVSRNIQPATFQQVTIHMVFFSTVPLCVAPKQPVAILL